MSVKLSRGLWRVEEFNTGIPDAKGAKVAQKTQKRKKRNLKTEIKIRVIKTQFTAIRISYLNFSFLRLLCNFCALCVRYPYLNLYLYLYSIDPYA